MPAARSPLDLDHDTMRRLGRQVADHVAEHLSAIRDTRVVTTLSRAEATRLIASDPPARGADFDALLRFLDERVFANALHEPHPGFVGYVPSCPTFPATLGDWLVAGYNFFGGVWQVGSGPGELELVVLDWFRQWLGMPAGTGGLLTSGGSTANLMALVAARHAVVGDDATVLPRLTVYLSDQTHSSAIRAAWIAGITRAHVRTLPCDDQFRLSLDDLEDAIARDRADGLVPLAVIANGGTTNTGAVDPLPDLAELCARESMWLHVDAAYGGFSVLTEYGRRALAGIERADSVTMDPHKWLFVPFECGCVLARDPARLKAAFQIYPDYLQDVRTVGAEVNFADYGEQLTRMARAVKVWLGVSYFGTDALADAIAAGIARAERGEHRVRATAGLEVLAPATLGVMCFRAHPPHLDDPERLDALNERVNAAITARGRFLLSTTRLRGAVSLRICPIGFRTTNDDIDALIDEAASESARIAARAH